MSKNQSRKFVRALINENRRLKRANVECSYEFPPYDCTPRRGDLFNVVLLFGLLACCVYGLYWVGHFVSAAL